MQNVIDKIQFAFAALGGFLGWFFGGFDGFLYALIVFVVTDYFTGILAAGIRRELSSEVGFKGIAKKVCIFLLVGMANIIDTQVLQNGAAIRTAVVFFYKEMDWSGDCRYKILGYRIEFEGEALYVFDLVAAEVFHECKKKQSADQQPTTVAEENTEEQPVNPRKGYYPDDIAGTFGMPVEQHRQESELRQMDGFVSVGMLTGMPGQQQNL